MTQTTDWSHYIRASYDIVRHVEPNIHPEELDQTLESYLVNLLARHFRSHNFGEKPVAISLMESLHLPGFQKKQSMSVVGDECLWIYGFGCNRSRWPSASYYVDMGTMAYGHASIAIQPTDLLYSHLEENFNLMGKVIRKIGPVID
jgi:hypothetical protein